MEAKPNKEKLQGPSLANEACVGVLFFVLGIGKTWSWACKN